MSNGHHTNIQAAVACVRPDISEGVACCIRRTLPLLLLICSGIAACCIFPGATLTAEAAPSCSYGPVWRDDTDYYPSIQAACTSLTGDVAVKVIAGETTGDIEVSAGGHTLMLLGGYDCQFSGRSGYSEVNGKVTISSGTVVFDGIAIQYALPGGNRPPEAVIETISPNPATLGQTVSFAGKGTDSDGSVSSYRWTSNLSGILSTSASFASAALPAGSHTISLVVYDDDGTPSSAASRVLVVQASNAVPVAVIDSITPSPATLGQSVSFTGHGTDTDGTVVGYEWTSSIDGPLSTKAAFSTGALSVGSHVIQLIVYDDKGAPSSAASRVLAVQSSNALPVAVIDSITPSPATLGQSVSFAGHGTDADGTVVGYEWTSSLDGSLAASATFSTAALRSGIHTIGLRVRDNKGSWSAPATRTLRVDTPAGEIIVDNLDSATSSTGAWSVSGAPNPYGPDSVWSRDGASFSWIFTPTTSGMYEVSMWWTQYTTRSTSIPVDIQHAGGLSRVVIDQQHNGGAWNVLGTYAYDAGVTYTVTITAQASPSSTCADAVRFAPAGNNLPPVATIVSVSPNPAAVGSAVTFTGSGADSDGTVAAYSWRSSIDGQLGSAATFSSNTLTVGTHTIYLKVQDNGGAWSPEASLTLIVSEQVLPTEHIYIVVLYNTKRAQYVEMLLALGAVQQGTVWKYTDAGQQKDYIFHLVEDMAGAVQALYTEDAHVIIGGHSNYGMGGIFATPEETESNVIESLRYIDDTRLFTYSTPTFFVSVIGMVEGQRYPNWRPIFQDGSSGIMPYVFGDPRGDPAYNYFHTYQVPGDPIHYKVETVRNTARERFPDSGATPWYAADGSLPDAANPEHAQYYITNTSNSFVSDARWLTAYDVSGYYGSSYCSVAAAPESGEARWNFYVPAAGTYQVFAWWPAADGMAPDAAYTVSDADGDHTVQRDQRISGGSWNLLGEFKFKARSYSVTLSGSASAGIVAADAIRITNRDNPELFDRVVDNLGCPLTHYGYSTILYRKSLDLDNQKFRYKRLLFDACSVGTYYLGTFHHGRMFYTARSSNGSGTYQYLQNYLAGKSDEEIWAAMQKVQPVYDYYDFTKRPDEQ